MDLTVVELFAGVGGFRVGLNNIKSFDKLTGLAKENGDWNFVWANQWEPSTKAQPAFECYIKRFGHENYSNLDISLIDKESIPTHSLLVGGFPCQDYSVARSLSNEMGIQGKKGVLWWEIADVLSAKKPPFVLLENVDRLLKSPAKQRGRDFAVMLKTFEELGYIVQWRMINAGEYGMPQRRRRIFIFASLKNTKYSKKISENKEKEKHLEKDAFFNSLFPIRIKGGIIEKKSLSHYKDVLEVSNNYNEGKFLASGIFVDGEIINCDITEKYRGNIYSLGKIVKEARKYQKEDLVNYIISDESLVQWEYLKGNKKVPRKRPDGSDYFYAEGSMNFPDSLEIPSRTMLTSESTLNRSTHVVYDSSIDKMRKITEVEAELLQMFPANWTDTGMTSRQRYFMMGNALVTGVINKLEKKLKKIIQEE